MYGRRLPARPPVDGTAYGLKGKDGVSLPLTKVDVKVTMLDFLGEVCLEQSYQNVDKEATEVVYTFPIPSDATLRHFEVHVDDAIIKGQVQEKQEARDTYDDALASGHTGFMVEQDERMPDVFTCRVGNLSPNAKAKVQLIYVLQVEEEKSADNQGSEEACLRLVIPSAVAPRYDPNDSHRPPGIPSSFMTASGVGSPSKDLLHIHGDITSSTRIMALEPLHPSGGSKVNTDITPGTESLKATFTLVDSYLQDDFVLSIKLQGRHEDRAWIDRASGAMVLAMCPSHRDYLNEAQGEFLFVIDRSGSMEGQSIYAAREALALCVSSLPLGAKFNIISFGSNFVKWSPESRAFDDQSKMEALQLCRAMDADMGGTEILEPLRDIASKAVSDQVPRQVFIITDGQVANTAQVVEEVRSQATKSGTRYFSFGIGSGVSSALVKGIADAGKGESVFIVDAHERMQSKIMQQMNRALSAPLTGASIDWGTLRLTQEASPSKMPPLFADSRVLAYAMVDPASLPSDHSTPITLTVKATSPDGPIELPITARLTETNASIGPLLTALAAKSRLTDLEQLVAAASDDPSKATLKSQAVALSKSTGVLCAYTSFVAVQERTDAVTGTLKRVDIPLQIVKPSDAMSHAPMLHGRRLMMASCSRGPTFASCSPAPMFASCSAAPQPFRSYSGPPVATCSSYSGPPVTMCSSAPGFGSSSAFGGGGGGGVGGFGTTSSPAPAFGGAGKGFGGFGSGMAVPPPPPAPFAMPMSMSAPKKRSMMPNKCAEAAHLESDTMDVDMEVDNYATTTTTTGAALTHVSLVNRQRASGAWEMDEQIKQLAKSTFPGFQEGGTGPGPLSDPVVWSTVVVLLLLRRLFSQFEDEWKPASLKSRRWLAKTVPSTTMDDLLAQAAVILQ